MITGPLRLLPVIPAGRCRSALGLLVLGLLAFGLPACESETRVIHNRPMLAGLPGSESATPVSRYPKGYRDPTYLADDQLVVLSDDGTVGTLRARTARHLMRHIYSTLMNNEEELFVNQVLSEQTRREYYQHGLHPREAFQTLRDNAGDVLTLFDRMPMGESTPGLFLQPVGGGVQRLRVQGLAARDLRWVGFDMMMEKGNWRLVWFVPGP